MLTVDFTEGANRGETVLLVLDPASAAKHPRFDILDQMMSGGLGRASTAAASEPEKAVPLIVLGTAAEPLVVVFAAAGADPQDLGARLAGSLARSGIRRLALDAGGIGIEFANVDEWLGRLIGGLILALHRHEGQRTSATAHPEIELVVRNAGPGGKAAIMRQQILAANICHARELVLDPPNLLTPDAFAERCKRLAALGIAVEILDEHALRRMGMGGILAIAQGSREPPRVVVMRWQQSGSPANPLVLIGKGVTFDSGGLALKPKANMHDMKHDMAGAAAVVGAMRSIAQQGLHRHVVGVIGLVENMPGGAAVKPGDVVTMMSGLTVEIENPDAEGRIVLADLLHFAATRLSPSAMVDIATLTGAVQTALGPEIAGLFANDDTLAAKLATAGAQTGDLVWRLPLHMPYDKHIEGGVSDLRNMGKPQTAGAIYAALFLQRFCHGVPWAHLDAGGVAWLREPTPLHPQGTTGYGVRLLEELAVKS